MNTKIKYTIDILENPKNGSIVYWIKGVHEFVDKFQLADKLENAVRANSQL